MKNANRNTLTIRIESKLNVALAWQNEVMVLD